MSDITLSAGVRQNLLSLQSTADLFSQTSTRLATGKKVNSALDNPNSFFTSQSLDARASDLSDLLDNESNAVQTVQAANDGLTAITKLVNSAKALANQALGSSATDTATRADLADQFNDLLEQIDQLASDASFNGVNLLNGDSLTVNFNEDNSSSVTITGVTDDHDGLGIDDVAAGGWNTDTAIKASLDQVADALTTLRKQGTTLSSNLSIVQTRQDFTKNLINTLQVGSDNLTLADTNEEAANLTALQTRQQISISALSMTTSSEQQILRLFS